MHFGTEMELDPEELKDNLRMEIIRLHGDLKRLGYDMGDFLRNFQIAELACPPDAQIPKLQNQIQRMQKLLDHVIAASPTPGPAPAPAPAPAPVILQLLISQYKEFSHI